MRAMNLAYSGYWFMVAMLPFVGGCDIGNSPVVPATKLECNARAALRTVRCCGVEVPRAARVDKYITTGDECGASPNYKCEYIAFSELNRVCQPGQSLFVCADAKIPDGWVSTTPMSDTTEGMCEAKQTPLDVVRNVKKISRDLVPPR